MGNHVNRSKIMLALVSVAILSVVMTGCQATLSEETIKSAFEQYELPIGESVEIESVEVVRRSEEDKEDISLCQVEAVGETASYTAYFTVEYKYYDKGGWILEDIYPADTDGWTATYNETGIKTVEDAAEDAYNLCGDLPVEQEYLTLNWEKDSSPRRVDTDADGEQLAQVFNGTAAYEDDFCIISAPFELLYFFDASWDGSEFVASWDYAYSYSGLRGNVNDCLQIDLSGTWVGDSPYGVPLVLTLDTNENGGFYGHGGLYGKLKCEVPVEDFTHYPRGVGVGGVVDLGCSNLCYYFGDPGQEYDYDYYGKHWTTDFSLNGEGNENYKGYGNDLVGLLDLMLNVNDKTLTGRYWRTYGTQFDVVLTWEGR